MSWTHLGFHRITTHILLKLFVVVNQALFSKAWAHPLKQTLQRYFRSRPGGEWSSGLGGGHNNSVLLLWMKPEIKQATFEPLTQTMKVVRGEADLMRWIWMGNDRSDMNSEHIWRAQLLAEQWNHRALWRRRHTEALQSDSAWPRFQFSFPQKTMIILLNFTPSKLRSDLQAPQQSCGSEICIWGFMGNMFEDLQIKCNIKTFFKKRGG